MRSSKKYDFLQIPILIFLHKLCSYSKERKTNFTENSTMIKRLAAATLLILPVAISALPAKASALEVFIGIGNHRPNLIAHRDDCWRWVPPHWEGHGRYQHFVPGHCE
jgi:hypothetical protein